ncbi:MAG: hypothetical protein ACT4TC_16055 [Myxococcaceae bacterium]
MSKLTRQISGVVEGTMDESMRTQTDAASGTAVDSLMSRRLQVRRRVRTLEQGYARAHLASRASEPVLLS